MDNSEVSAIGSIRPVAPNTRYQSAASARPNCEGPEMNAARRPQFAVGDLPLGNRKVGTEALARVVRPGKSCSIISFTASTVGSGAGGSSSAEGIPRR